MVKCLDYVFFFLKRKESKLNNCLKKKLLNNTEHWEVQIKTTVYTSPSGYYQTSQKYQMLASIQGVKRDSMVLAEM